MAAQDSMYLMYVLHTNPIEYSRCMTNRHILYRIYDAAGALLYVGATTNPGQRFRDHGRTQPWWDEATEIKLERFNTYEELAEAEIEAINCDWPKHNLVHAEPFRPFKPRRTKGDGALFQRKGGLWEGRFELPPGPDGKRRYKSVTSRDRSTVLQKLEALKASHGHR